MLSTYAMLCCSGSGSGSLLLAVCCIATKDLSTCCQLPYLLKEEVICVSSPQEKGREEKGREEKGTFNFEGSP